MRCWIPSLSLHTAFMAMPTEYPLHRTFFRNGVIRAYAEPPELLTDSGVRRRHAVFKRQTVIQGQLATLHLSTPFCSATWRGNSFRTILPGAMMQSPQVVDGCRAPCYADDICDRISRPVRIAERPRDSVSPHGLPRSGKNFGFESRERVQAN
jgi:hypothetical protein